MELRIVPVDLDEANAFVAAFHRHHIAGARRLEILHRDSDGGEDCGVAICSVGQVAANVDDGRTMEVNRNVHGWKQRMRILCNYGASPHGRISRLGYMK